MFHFLIGTYSYIGGYFVTNWRGRELVSPPWMFFNSGTPLATNDAIAWKECALEIDPDVQKDYREFCLNYMQQRMDMLDALNELAAMAQAAGNYFDD